MTARGVEFLNDWVSKNVPALPVRGDVLIRALAQKLKDEASAGGFTVADMEIENSQVEQFMRERLVQFAELGTPG